MKKKIVLASVLKPPDDVRMYEKLGKSLADNYEVHLFGQTTDCLTSDEQVRFYPLFRREKWQRLKASWIFFRQLRKVNPEAIIVCTVELLPSALLYKILFRKKLFYDVQENYAYNFMYQHVYPFPTKYLMALVVRMLEWISRPLVNHYFLAEQTYAKEFSFSQGKHIILENKAIIPSEIVPQPAPIQRLPTRFVYSGTISAVYGALDALDFILQLKEHIPSVQLLFIGRFAEKSVAERIKTAAQHHPTNVRIIGGDKWVSHRLILQVLSTADIAILP
ncbi:MAG: hypothetical protein NZ521_10570, partial [Flammeovirgaceae bacterium]|nr:hypothetical protein [Flammeovirgaceae bacterium]MDW8286830.1 hypothetical protein [Flammeovirgaceae bacterium]